MLIIAEIGLNHNGDMHLAQCMIDEARAAGADIVKFQIFDPSKLFPQDFEWMDYHIRVRLSFEQVKLLRNYCDHVGIEFCASVFDLEGLEWCDTLDVRRLKVASRSIYDSALIGAMSETGKDMIVSLGMWDGPSFPEISTAGRVDFLYCVAKYPTPLSDINFSRVDFSKYGGFSDHTEGIDAAAVAIARGARIIEKHFTLSKMMDGPDHICSVEPHELRQLVDISRRYSKCLHAAE